MRAASTAASLWATVARPYRICWWRRVPSKIELILDDDIARCVDALAADLGDGRAGAALAVALLAAHTDSWSQRAARGLLPACGDRALRPGGPAAPAE